MRTVSQHLMSTTVITFGQSMISMHVGNEQCVGIETLASVGNPGPQVCPKKRRGAGVGGAGSNHTRSIFRGEWVVVSTAHVSSWLHACCNLSNLLLLLSVFIEPELIFANPSGTTTPCHPCVVSRVYMHIKKQASNLQYDLPPCLLVTAPHVLVTVTAGARMLHLSRTGIQR